MDYSNKLQDYANNLKDISSAGIEQHSCPNCGACPHCGRGGYQTSPYVNPTYPYGYPYHTYTYPYPYPYPEWNKIWY